MTRNSFHRDFRRSADDQLAKLPDKVLLQLFERVADVSKHTLCNVSRLNKRYHALADAILYRKTQFLTPELHLIFSESLGRRPRRGSAILEVKLAYPASEVSHFVTNSLGEPHIGRDDDDDDDDDDDKNGDGGEGPNKETPSAVLEKKAELDRQLALPRSDQLSRTIAAMSNLETLDIAVPDTLLHGIGQLFDGPFDLTCLRSCTLFYQCKDDAYWDLRGNIHIFGHPTLETLVIKRAKLDYEGFDLLEQPHATALKRLHLIECDINDDALSDILVFPEALREFVMTQPEDPSPDLEESSDSIRDYMSALKSACHSLESITIDSPNLSTTRALLLREFDALKTLRFNWDHQLFGKSSKKPRLNSVGFPPMLETLEFFNELGTDAEVTELFVYALENLDMNAKHLERLIVVEHDDEKMPKEIVDACKAHPRLQLDIIGAFDTVEDDKHDLDDRVDEDIPDVDTGNPGQ